MGQLSFWHENNQILGMQLWGKMTLPQLHQLNLNTLKLLDKQILPVGLIIDLTEVDSFPDMDAEFLDSQIYLTHRKLDWVIGYGDRGSLAIAKAAKTYGKAFPIFETWAEIVDWLGSLDQHILWSE